MMRLLEFISFDPKSIKAMPLEHFNKDPPGLWLIIQNSIPFSWLKNCRINIILIAKTSRVPPLSLLTSKLLKDQAILAKETENMFTGSEIDSLWLSSRYINQVACA